MREVAKIILINSKKQIIMPLRDNKPEISYPNHWAEIGGEIELGESPIEAFKREIKEEISCKVYEIEGLGEVFNSDMDCKINFFKGKIFERLENIKLYEGQRLGLFTFEETKNLLIPKPLKDFITNNYWKIF